MVTDPKSELVALLRARNSLFWVVSREEARVEAAVIEAAGAARYETVLWDCVDGLKTATGQSIDAGMKNPSAVLQRVIGDKSRRVYVLRDLHRWLDSVVLRYLRSAARALSTAPRNEARAIVVLTPSGEVPLELQGCATVIDWPIPTRVEMGVVLDSAVAGLPDDLQSAALTNGAREAAIDAAIGLTADEAASCYAKSLVTQRAIVPGLVATEKKRVIARERVLTWIDPEPRGLDAVGGLELLKAWLIQRRTALSKAARDFGLPSPKGVLLVGVPGCLHGDTPIYDPVDGSTRTVRRRWALGLPFHVWALGPDGPVTTTALPPVRKPPEAMIRFTLSDGESITVTTAHRFWDGYGWVRAFEVYERLQGCGSYLLPSSSDSDLQARIANAPRSSKTVEDSQGGCQPCRRCDGEQLPTGQVGVRSSAPLRADVLGCTHRLRPDGSGFGSWCSRLCRVVSRLSMQGLLRRCIERSRSVRGGLVRSLRGGLHRLGFVTCPAPRLLGAGVAQSGTVRSPDFYVPGSKPFADSGSWLRYTGLRAELQEPAEFFDFHVPGYENYWACGLWHHNCGKSLSARAVATAWGVPLLRLDLGALRSKWVGESESNIRKALSVAETVAPCVLWCDELEKALGGAVGSGGGAADGGVSTDALGALLTWLQERTASVFVVATANQAEILPAELTRRGRFDDVFFVDLPNLTERGAVLRTALAPHAVRAPEIDLGLVAEKTQGFSGAEIAALVPDALFAAFADGARNVRTADILAVAESVVPMSVSASERISQLRSWAKGRARAASVAEVDAVGVSRAVDL